MNMNETTKPRIIKSNGGVNGQISENEKRRSAEINMNPVFTEDKPWKFIKVLKTSTKIVPWLIQIGDEYIVATQGWVARKSEIAMFYRSNKRGTFNIIQDRITEYWMYVDLEAAVDKFYAEFYEEAEMAKAIALEEETQNISNEEII